MFYHHLPATHTHTHTHTHTRTHTHTHTHTTHTHTHTHKHTHTHSRTHTQTHTHTQVWKYDGTVECYTEGHLPLAIWAFIVLAIYTLFFLLVPIFTHILLAVVSAQLEVTVMNTFSDLKYIRRDAMLVMLLSLQYVL